ncbi:MAG: LCP family protein [Ruminococcus sp.]|nr:LCP family protein [Ruminococcus sp.]MCM1479709.1 LCP family protein [Muribaculaceae bacterium]
MAKKSSKIALTYFITIIVTFIIIGGLGYMLLQYLESPAEKTPEEVTINPLDNPSGYVPNPGDDVSTLFIFDSVRRQSGVCFMLVRTLSAEQKLVFMPLPADTAATLDGSQNTLYEFYRLGGSQKAVSAAEKCTGTKIDYYMKLNNDSFAAIVSIFGNVDVNIPYNLIYSDPDTGEETIYREGSLYADHYDMRKILTYPLYTAGEEYRAKILGVIASDLVNKNVASGFSSHVDDYFSTVINSPVETNFTAYDYEERSELLKYIANSSERIVKLVTVSGSYGESGFFELDENFVRAIPEWLGINTVNTYEE